MAAREIRVRLTLDWSAFKESMRRAIRATSSFEESLHRIRRAALLAARIVTRINDTPGDQHIDRICRQIATGVPGRPAHIRLTAASDLAAILDRKTP